MKKQNQNHYQFIERASLVDKFHGENRRHFIIGYRTVEIATKLASK